MYQFDPGSNFLAALDRDDETPGAVDYSSMYTVHDEFVRPVSPVPTATLDWDHEGARVSNVAVQDVCPGRPVGHSTSAPLTGSPFPSASTP